MRIDQLWVSDFKNLKDISVDFSEEHATTVLVGRNGTGKSNLLEALTIVFRDLDLSYQATSAVKPAFQYVIKYTCRGHKVVVDADPKRTTGRLKIQVDGEAISFKRFAETPGRPYLPTYIFGYYSGPSNRMEEHFLLHQQRFYKNLIDGVERPLRPLLYARPVHSMFVLLAFFLETSEDVAEFLKENLRIEGLDSALFVMREPPWNSNEGDERFWKARGTVQSLLDKLYELALAPLRQQRRIPIEFRQDKTLEFLYLYLKDLDTIRQLHGDYPSDQAFFKALESTYISRLIDEVQVRVKSRAVDGSLTFRELSEGEQQLLMVLGLLRFTREEESLFLLDEPDTHLNPAWSVQYHEFLRTIGGLQENSHILMATHDPLVIAGLVKEQVQILQRDMEAGRITAIMPDEDPRGMGVAALLTSEVYGLRSQLDLETLQLLDRKRELAAKEHLTPSEADDLTKLSTKLGGLDFTRAVRDPLYKPFVEAMTKLQHEEGLLEPVLTKAQQERQRELAFEVVQRLKAQGE